ncbi:phospholipase d - related [Holotrichia oblita]|uniref:Phospholipase d - related n=1 Tax=Holotrichia oblita TaxID=644536 RepID=A0ACB9SR56_HOLOL|nr:phospholipase d - related [Holotrichia oblita]
MPKFWDYFGRSSPKHRNLQEGLFQIASQTCNLLVQVNNTNNISFGDNATNILSNTLDSFAGYSSSREDREQLVVLLPPTNISRGSRFKNTGGLLKPRLSTVLETPVIHNDEEADLWNHAIQVNPDGSPIRRASSKRNWCRPSCIPISIILILIFLVVLLPLLDHAAEKALQAINQVNGNMCQQKCRFSLIESIPEGMTYPNGTASYPSTYETWYDLIDKAQHTIEIASFYWTLRQDEVYPDPSSVEGEEIYNALLTAGLDKNIKIKIAQNAPSLDQPNTDTESLGKKGAAQVRSLNFRKAYRFWCVAYEIVVKEMGIVGYNCSCLADDIGKIFDVYWQLGEKGAKIPDHWPYELHTKYNNNTPMNVITNTSSYQVYVSSSPPPFSPDGRTNDIDAILNVIHNAEKFIYISVMDYFPLTIYTPKLQFWPLIDSALRKAALEHGVQIKLLISKWTHSRKSADNFLKSLADISNSYPKVSIEIRRFIVPATKEQKQIPFARVNHNKYMVTESTAYIGTSNWSGDYFINTAGVAFVLQDGAGVKNDTVTIRSQLQSVFERDWNSNYSYPIEVLL